MCGCPGSRVLKPSLCVPLGPRPALLSRCKRSSGPHTSALTGRPVNSSDRETHGLGTLPQALQRCSHCAQAGQSCRRPSARPHCCSHEPRLLRCPGAIVSRPLLRTPLTAPTLSWPPASLTFLSLQNLSFLSPHVLLLSTCRLWASSV